LTPLAASAQAEMSAVMPDSSSEHVTAAVEELFELDDARHSSARLRLERQNVARCDIDVCIDPRRGWLSGSCRLRFDTVEGSVELSLNEALTVLSLVDENGRMLAFSRSGRIVTVPPGSNDESRSRELTVTYEGLVRRADGGLVAGRELVVLLGDDCWYPCPREGDASFVRVILRHPMEYASVVSGALAGMAAPTATRPGSCAGGDVWEADSIARAAAVVGRIDSSWSILGELFIGSHRYAGLAAGVGASERDGSGVVAYGDVSDALRPLDLAMKEPLRFLESCFGPYPFGWLHIVTVPYGVLGSPAVSGPGLIIVEASAGDAACLSPPDPDLYLLELARSWWWHALDAGAIFSEGLAAHMEIRWLESVRGEEDAARRRSLRRGQYLRAMADSGGAAPLSLCLGPDASRDTRVSRGRGGALMDICASLIGHDRFCDVIRGLAEDVPAGAPSLRVFAAALSDAAGRRMDWLLYEWVYRGDLPVYVLEYEARRYRGGYRVSGTVRQLVEAYRTPLPLTVDLGGWEYDEWIAIASPQQSFEFVTELEPLGVTIDAGNIVPRVESSDQARVHYELGSRAAAANEWDKAVDQFGAAVALDPERPAYHARYGEALVRVGRPVEGLEAVSQAISLEPGNAGYWLRAGRLAERAGDHRGAVERFEHYVEQRPADPAGYVELAVSLVELGRLPEARSQLERARALSVDAHDDALLEHLYLATGRYQEARGEQELAVSAYSKALELNPVSDEARRRLVQLRAH
ncbi:tetratricopeptide repeat protein, partial [bacterium]|nr:tetratricopeptide repeat protein [bacterium]